MGMIRFARTAAIVLAAGTGICPAAGSGAESDIKTGRAIAERLCARCHAVGQTGDSPTKAAPPFRSFSRKWPLENLEEALAEGIVVGHESMPEFELTEAQIDAFLAYLKTLKPE
jgi:cytochrome c